MGLDSGQKKSIKATLKKVLRSKFENYNPELAFMPFHTRLLGKDRLALYQFINSLNTNFGTTIFEPIAVELASTKFKTAEAHIKAGNKISEKALFEIQKIMDNLTAANAKPDKLRELKILRQVAKDGIIRTVSPTNVDIYLESKENEIFLIDIKTAKPNKGGFKEF